MKRRPSFSALTAPFFSSRPRRVLTVDSCQARGPARMAVTSSALAAPFSHNTSRTADSASLIDSAVMDALSRRSARAVRCGGDTPLIGDPIGYPRAAAVGGKRLLEMRRHRGDPRPDIADENVAALVQVVRIELADAVLELADIGWSADGPTLARCPVEAPLTRLRVVEPQRHALDRLATTAHLHLLDLRAAVPQPAGLRSTMEHHPAACARQRVGQSPHLEFPCAELEIEVVLAIVDG